MIKKADIIIIGGGILGNAIASYLSQKTTAKILLLEQNQLCTGSTSFSASLVTKLRHEAQLIPLVEETHRAVKQLESKFGEPQGERSVGCIHAAASGTTLDDLRNLTEIAEDFDFDFEIIKNSKLQKKLPWINTEKIFEAVFVPDEFYLDGAMFGMAFFKDAKQNGIQHLTNTYVSEIVIKNEQVKGVQANGQFIYSPIVVDAAGIWSNILLKKTEKLVPFAPVRSLYFITNMNKKLYPSNQPICILPDANAYTRPEAGALLVGIRDQQSPWTHPISLPKNLYDQKYISIEEQWEILMNQTTGLQNLMLNFENLRIAHTISAPCAYTYDGNLILGKIDGIEGLFVATGCNGGGIATSGGIGRAMAEIILEEIPFINIEQFNPNRSSGMNIWSEDFMQMCSDIRAKKKSG